ncbi:uncharacterized protein LOC135499986 [Lineus longissimus]|uniref:uncharacterized protein LOC135499986 n=1 Tax=Lineus longissimus TaxID=88925 RepID=UPI00315D7FD4
MALTTVSKRRQSKIQQDFDGRQKDLKVNKSNIHVNLDMEKEPDVVSISEQPFEEVPIIRRPFSSKGREPSDRRANWKTPNFPKQDRGASFKWDKPLNSEESTSYSSPGQQLQRLNVLLHEKDRELEIVRNQLKKAQTDNYNLIKELQGYKGEHYDDLKKDNLVLKEQIDRVIRENMKLCGLRRQDQNTKLQELKLKEELQRKHGVRNRNATPRRSVPNEDIWAEPNGLLEGDVSLHLSNSDGGLDEDHLKDKKVSFDEKTE